MGTMRRPSGSGCDEKQNFKMQHSLSNYINHSVRLIQTEKNEVYLPFIALGCIPLALPLCIYFGFDLLLYLGAGSATFITLMLLERKYPNSIFNFIVALPIYFFGVALYAMSLVVVLSAGEMNPLYASLAIISGVGKILVDGIIIRKLTPEAVVNALIERQRVSMSQRGIVVTPPWASDLFTEFSRGEAVLIWSVRAILGAACAWAYFRYGPVMYSSTGAVERLPHGIALTGFPIAFFLAPLWQIPFMYYCHKHADQLVDAAEKQRLREYKAALKAKQEARENA